MDLLPVNQALNEVWFRQVTRSPAVQFKYAGIVVAIVPALIFASLAAAQTLAPLERGIYDEVDQLRGNPSDWVNILKAERPWSPGLSPAIPDPDAAATHDAVLTLEEAISALEKLRGALPRVEFSPALSRAAADHVRDTGSRGLTGHRGADGSSLNQRIERYGSWSGHIAENIVYGTSGARDAVFDQLLDFGIRDRGHRWTLLSPAWRYVGISCGPHTLYRIMCVLDFASDYHDRAGLQPARSRLPLHADGYVRRR
jgi:uncharacterized protein YkwD